MLESVKRVLKNYIMTRIGYVEQGNTFYRRLELVILIDWSVVLCSIKAPVLCHTCHALDLYDFYVCLVFDTLYVGFVGFLCFSMFDIIFT